MSLPLRFEWVKMFYPDLPKGVPVGVIYRWEPPLDPLSPFGPSRFVFYTKTNDTAKTKALTVGIDAGILTYLKSLESQPSEIHVLPLLDYPMVYRAPLVLFEGLTPEAVVTTFGAPRSRLFLPLPQWGVLPQPYRDVKPPFWQVTHIREDGSVIERKDPR